MKIRTISISNSFLEKSRCRYCGGLPIDYSKQGAKAYTKELNKKLGVYRVHNYKSDFYYILDQASYLYDLSDFSSPAIFSYNPHFHRVLNRKTGKKILSGTDEIICECGRTAWSFSDFIAERYSRVDLTNKKAATPHFRKFITW